MKIYKVKQLTTGKEYDLSYPNEDYLESLLKIKLNDKDIIVEVEFIYGPKVKKSCESLEIVDVISKNKYEKLTLENITFFDMSNQRIVGKLTELNVHNFEYASCDLKNDKEFIRKLLNRDEIKKQEESYCIIEYVSDDLKNDSDYALKLISYLKTGAFLKYFNESVRNDSKVMLEALSFKYANAKVIIDALGDKLLNDPGFFKNVLFTKLQAFSYLPKSFKEDLEFATEVVSKNGQYLKYFSKKIRSNPNIIQLAEKNQKQCYHDLFMDFNYCKYVNLRTNYSLSYPNSKNKCVNNYSRNETLATNILNIVVIDNDIAKNLLVRDEKLHRWILNYENLVSDEALNDCITSSKNWQILKKYKDRVIVTFDTEDIDSDGLTEYISKLIKKYPYKVDWYFIEKVIRVNYDSYDFKYALESGYSPRETLPKVYTKLFYDEDGYVADEYIPSDLNFLKDALYYYGDDLFDRK